VTRSAGGGRAAEPSGFLYRAWSADPRQLWLIRAEVHRWLVPLGFDEDTEHNIVLAVNEAATNAIEHAYPPATAVGTVELTLWTECDHLCIEVVDRGTWREPPTNDRGRGFGLVMMRCLVAGLLVDHDAEGTCVLLRHPLPEGSTVPAKDRLQRIEPLDDD
jgi:serine/threonine-protein kinase RsbW